MEIEHVIKGMNENSVSYRFSGLNSFWPEQFMMNLEPINERLLGKEK